MDITNILNLQCILFILIAVGTIARIKGIIKTEGKKLLTDLLIYIFLPCNIISSFNMKFNMEILKKFAMILIFATLTQIVCMILSKFVFKNVEERKRKVLEYATICSNAAFLGLPVVEELFGLEGVMYASIAMVPQRIVMWSSGISCFTQTDSFGKVFKQVALHPCIIAVYIGLTKMFLPFNIPAPIEYSIATIGGCTLTTSMLLIGTMLGEMKDIRSIFSLLLLKYTVIRLVIIPFFSMILCTIGGLDNLSVGVIALLSGMPAGSTTAILASKYDGDYIFASKVIIFSTVLSIFTIPMWNFIFNLYM